MSRGYYFLAALANSDQSFVYIFVYLCKRIQSKITFCKIEIEIYGKDQIMDVI